MYVFMRKMFTFSIPEQRVITLKMGKIGVSM